MQEQNALYWTRLSHQSAPHLLLGTVILFAFLIVVRITIQKRGATGLKPLWIGLNVFAWPCLLLMFVGQLHLPCSQIAYFKSNCITTAKSLAMAQLAYTSDNDGAWCETLDWQDRLARSDATCPGAMEKVSYAFNERLIGTTIDSVLDSAQVMVFDSDRKSVCDASCLATMRHDGVPVVVTIDGAARGLNSAVRAKLKW